MYLFRVAKPYVLCDKSQTLHVFNGKYYETVNDSFLGNALSRVLENIGAGRVYRLEYPKKIAGIIATEIVNQSQCDFKPNRRYIAFNNCVLDIKEDRMLDFSGEYITDICIDFDYDPFKTCELWDKFICQTFPVEGFRDTFQWFCGALLVNRREYKIEYSLFIVGPGGNGKSVVMDSISNMFGNGLIAKFSTTQLFDASNSQQNMAALEGKIANFTDDIDKKLLSGGDFKTFVSGGQFQARLLYKEPFIVEAPFMMCCANEMPPTADDTEGHHRRILPIKSTDHIYKGEERDTQLTNKLSTTEARQAIFNWLYEGYKRVIADKGNLELPSCVTAFRNSVRDNSNNLRRWLKEVGYVVCSRGDDKGTYVLINELFTEYEDFCSEERIKEKNVKSKSNFKDALGVIGFITVRRNNGWFVLLKKEKTVYDDDGNVVSVEAAEIPAFVGMTEEELPF
jgi:putative DNA primase/helicase